MPKSYPVVTLAALALLLTVARARGAAAASPGAEGALVGAAAADGAGLDPATGGARAADPHAVLDRRIGWPAAPLAPSKPRSPESPRSGSSAAGVALLRATVWADPLFGTLYDMDPLTAALRNPRPTGLAGLAGIASTADGARTYVLRAHTSGDPAYPVLFAVDVASGTPTELGPGGVAYLIEGDLDFDPLTGWLYGTWELDFLAPADSSLLLRFDTTTGAASRVGSMFGVTDPHALAFDAAGELYVLSRSPPELHVVDPGTGAVVSSVALPPELDCAIGGLDFHPTTGELYVATSGLNVFRDCPNALWRVDTTTGVATFIGGTGALGVSGIEFFTAP